LTNKFCLLRGVDGQFRTGLIFGVEITEVHVICVWQIEIHPYFQQQKLVNFSHKRNIVVTAFSSFCSPGR